MTPLRQFCDGAQGQELAALSRLPAVARPSTSSVARRACRLPALGIVQLQPLAHEPRVAEILATFASRPNFCETERIELCEQSLFEFKHHHETSSCSNVPPARRAASTEQAADARPGDAIDCEQAQRADDDQDYAERGRLAVRAGDVEGENAERDHLPAAEREKNRG